MVVDVEELVIMMVEDISINKAIKPEFQTLPTIMRTGMHIVLWDNAFRVIVKSTGVTSIKDMTINGILTKDRNQLKGRQ
jgi:hypothetical protein